MTADPYRDCIHIAAEPEVVFDYFTSAEALARWMGDRAVVDPRPGGQFTIFFADRRVEGHYLEVDRPRRLVISWGRAGSATFPPGASVLEVTLTPQDGGTLVTIAHGGLPGGERHRHAAGWRHYLARLSWAATGRDLAPHVTPWEIVQGADLWARPPPRPPASRIPAATAGIRAQHRACDLGGAGGAKRMADVPADVVSAYYEILQAGAESYDILQAGAESYDPERLRSILVPDLDFDGPIAGRVRGADRFTHGVAGFIETQHGIRFLQQLVTHDAAAVLYEADLPGGTLRFAEFFRFDGGQIASIKLLYDPARYTEFGGR